MSPLFCRFDQACRHAAGQAPVLGLTEQSDGARLLEHEPVVRWFPSILMVLTIIRPETLVRWHRARFRCYWHWKSRPDSGYVLWLWIADKTVFAKTLKTKEIALLRAPVDLVT